MVEAQGPVTEERWAGQFGDDYTVRNPQTASEMDKAWIECRGVSRTQVNELVLRLVSRKGKVLEVGCNVGCQIALLRRLGFSDLYGVDINRDVLWKGNAAQASAFHLPFVDGAFDMVFTSGVLIHIAPEYVLDAMREIVRCSRRFVWGFEYYLPTEQPEQVTYRSETRMLWKADYAALYQRVARLRVICELLMIERGDKYGMMFLLEKR